MDKYKKCINYLEASFYHEEGECSKGYSKKMCKDVHTCYYKQLLAEQAKNKKLVEALEKFSKFNCGDCPASEIDPETGEAEFCESCCNFEINKQAQQALNEVNKC